MDSTERVYHDLTGVDIEQQRILWDERGRGYYGEYLVFREIYPNVPGNCKVLMNLQIPTPNGRSTEIDLLLIHETGLYVFEVKHYKGTIYGQPDEARWTQYFRTAPNQSFRSPIAQNQYHIHALENKFPKLRAHSYIVFTNPECTLKVECNESNITVCHLDCLDYYLKALNTNPSILSADQIDGIFRHLLPFAPVMQHPVVVTDKEIPFYEFVNAINGDYHSQVQAVENECHSKVMKIETSCRDKIKENEASCLRQIQSANRRRVAAITGSIIACAACIALCIATCIGYKKYSTEQINAAQTELQAFAQKFEKVEPYNNGNISLKEDFITASGVQLSQSLDAEDSTNFTFTLNWNGQYYGLNITKESTIIVILKDGSVKEYGMPEKAFPNYSTSIRLGPDSAWYHSDDSYTFPTHSIPGVYLGDIAYIKLSNLGIWELQNNTPTIIATGYEVEIYG